MRATFAILRLRNKITPDKEGSVTIKYPEQKEMRILKLQWNIKNKDND